MRTVRIDPHVHTRGSFDSDETVRRVLYSAADAGLDGVVVTDHDSITHSLKAASLASELGLVGIPGIEVSTADGHVLGIGVSEEVPMGETFDATVERIRELGGLAVVPHPFQVSRHGVPSEKITDCDGIEVLNAHTFTGLRNRQASRYAVRNDYPRFGGSDAHRAVGVGYAYTEVELEIGDKEPTSENVLEAMRAGRTEAHGQGVPTTSYLRKFAEVARRNSTNLLRV